MRTVRTTITGTSATRWIAVLGLATTAAYVSFLLILMDRSGFDVWGAVVVAPVLVALSIHALRRQAVREADPRTFGVLLLALLVKLGGGALRYHVAFSIYGGVADATGYHTAGVALARRLRDLDFSTLHLVTGAPFIREVTGFVYALIGPSKMGGFLFFSWLGFWGLFFFYRAFVLGVPLGHRRWYAALLFFLPSLVFWPSSIGKEAWMMFTLGVAALGAARILGGALFRGLAIVSPALWLAGMVRPHVAGLIGVALAAAVVLRKSRTDLRELAPVIKGASILIIGVLAVVLVVRTDHFLKRSGIETDRGVTSTLTDIQGRTSEGGSSFEPSIVDSPVRAPMAAVTVLFRPFVPEAHNTQSLLAALEGTALLLFCLWRIPWVWAGLTSLRRQPYVVFCLLYSGMFIVAFSSFANFGLLARERVQLYPLFLVLISIPPASVRRRTGSPPEEAVAPA